ncbi:MAG: molecular chaperone TorD family protein, partial [Pseudomonadales bacterium]
QAGSQAISLRESGYSKLTEKALMEEVFRFYQHFGLNVAKLAEAGLKELPDHLCVQLEFLHYMTYLEANALRSPPATANLGALRRAQCDFITRHPGSWINALTLKLTQADSTGFYANVSVLLNRFMQQERLFLLDSALELIPTSSHQP